MTNKKEKLSEKIAEWFKKTPFKQNKDPRGSFFLFIIIALIFSAVYTMFWDKIMQNGSWTWSYVEAPFSDIQDKYSKWELEKIIVENNKIKAITKTWEKIFSFKLPQETVKDLWFNIPWIQTKIEIWDVESWSFWKDLVLSIIPIIIIFAIISYTLRQSTKWLWWGFWFGKSKAKMFDKESVKTKFTDVAWSEETKHELVEVVDFLKSPKKYEDMWAKIPKWVLLVWAPWTWKTLLARAVAGEAWVPFFGISGSEFIEMFVWVWASRVRDLFSKAKETAPAIIFIDEIDAIWKQRWWVVTWWWHDEREQTLNQILTEMDGFEVNQNVIVIAATNRPEILDKALMRPWRFDRQVVIEKPDIKERTAILEVHAKGKKLSEKINLEEVARKTPWFTWADLSNVMNEAAILAARHHKKSIEQSDLLEAVEKVMMWPERRSSVLTEKEKEITAYHEIWHALVSYFMPESDPVHKISIIARWRSLGSTWYLPKEEKKLYTESKFVAELASLYWWHVAEKFKFWEVSTWASNDIERATDIARKMVTQYWMSSLWPIQWEDRNLWLYTWADFSGTRNHSEEMAKRIDEEVIKILNKALKKAEELVSKNKNRFEKLAKILIEKETIFAKEFEDLMKK